MFAFRKGLGTCDALLCIGEWEEARIVQIDFSAAYMIGSTIRAFSIGSALWVLEALWCQY